MKKQLKQPIELPLEIPVPIAHHSIGTLKKPLITPNIKSFQTIESFKYLDSAKLCIKNPRFFRIDSFSKLETLPGGKRVIKRNLKYLKKTKYCRFKSTPSFHIWNFANQLEALNSSGIFGPEGHARTQFPLRKAAKNPTNFFKNLLKNQLTTRALNLDFTSLDGPIQKKQYAIQLKHIQVLFLSNVQDQTFFVQYQQEEKGLDSVRFLRKYLNPFTHLKSVALELLFQKCKSESFYDVFEILAQVPNLISLEIRMKFFEVDHRTQNLKKIIAKFTQLKYLSLYLIFDDSLDNSGKIFANIGSFKALKSLKLKIFTKAGFDHPDIINFVSAHKSLETLKLNVEDMRFDEYNELLDGVKKMKSLRSLNIIQRYEFPMSFGYGIVFKTLEVLKKLKSFTLKLASYGFDGIEMFAFIRHLAKHPSLEKVDISMRKDGLSNHPFNFDDEFYGNITKLRNKLRSFKLEFIVFPDPEYVSIFEEVEKIITPSGRNNRCFHFKRKFIKPSHTL